MKRKRAVSAVLLAAVGATALVLSGCAVANDPEWEPPGWAEGGARFVAAPAPLDPAGVGATTGQRLRNEQVGLQARFALLPGLAGFDDRVTAFVRDAVHARAMQVGVAYTPQVSPRGAGLADRGCVPGATLRPAVELLADPALGPPGGSGTAIVCDLVAAAGPVIGQRVRIITGDPAGVTADAATTLYADVTTGAVVTAAELWAPGAAARIWALGVEALRREAGALSLAPVAAADEASLAAFVPALHSTLPAPGGSLVVTIPAGFTAPELAELGATPTESPLTVEVPAELASTLTSPVGSALVSAGAAGVEFRAPPPVPLGRVAVDCDLFPCVALTYDDGPSDLTPDLLDALAARRAAATFFVLGINVKGHPGVVQRAVAEGHLVENHSWNHPLLPKLDGAAVGRQIRDTSAKIEATTGERVTMFRPPYGEYDAAVLAAAGLPAILWDVDTLDWKGTSDEVLVDRAVDGSRPGSIVLQHDIHANTVRTAGVIYDGLLDRGFSLVTVAQLFGGEVPASGAWRSAG